MAATWRARTDTFLKTQDISSRALQDHEKIHIPVGTIVQGEMEPVGRRHGRFRNSSREGVPLPEGIDLGFMPDWLPYVAPTVPADGQLPPLTELTANNVHFRPGGDTLVVTFDHLGARHQQMRPWAGKFVVDHGWSLLGITSRTNGWFRAPDLRQWLMALREKGFFARYRRVVFVGPSMGGFGAGSLCSLAPGCTLVMTSPQSTLNRQLVPWETRYPMARRLDWDGPLHDAAAEARHAGQIILAYDPHDWQDARHAMRFPDENRVLLPAPYLGQTILNGFLQMDVLKPFMRGCIEGTLTRDAFIRMMRGRRLALSYFATLRKHAERRGKTARLERAAAALGHATGEGGT